MLRIPAWQTKIADNQSSSSELVVESWILNLLTFLKRKIEICKIPRLVDMGTDAKRSPAQRANLKKIGEGKSHEKCLVRFLFTNQFLTANSGAVLVWALFSFFFSFAIHSIKLLSWIKNRKVLSWIRKPESFILDKKTDSSYLT